MSRARYTPQQQAFYHKYLNSKLWQLRKRARILKAGGRCEWTVDNFTDIPIRCPRTRYLQVHHNTYERLGAEQDGDLEVYCWFHHILEHLLWKRCSRCRTTPCLDNEIIGANWLTAMLATLGISLDTGPVNWKKLPVKEFFLVQVPSQCPTCLDQMGFKPHD